MKALMTNLLAVTLLVPCISYAHPGGPHGGPGPMGFGGHHERLAFLPDAATAVLIGGLTYYLLNGNYYQRQGDEYVISYPPAREISSAPLQALDFQGKRYYVQDGHYYQRNVDGEYIEVARPPGL